MTYILVSLGCTLTAVGIALWQNGTTTILHQHVADLSAQTAALRKKLDDTEYARAWWERAAKQSRPALAPARTIVAPQYHAPRAPGPEPVSWHSDTVRAMPVQ